ncbi:hypothetical protein ACEQ8H_002819 [Pleosporales sp. CAS-2024a]
MPLFAKFKKAKDAAADHKKTPALADAKPPSPPYKHVPTHARQDAVIIQPTTVRPEDLQARIAAARKKRAVSYQSPLASRHSVYPSCESSRVPSRSNSTAHFVPVSTTASLRGREKSAESIDTILRRPHSIAGSMPSSYGIARIPMSEYSASLASGSLGFPFAPTQRSRPTHSRSRRSSFNKRKSPLSMSVEEEEPEEDVFSSSSTTSTQSSATERSRNSGSDDEKMPELVARVAKSHSIQTPATVKETIARSASTSSRSRWSMSMFQRKGVDIVAH